jgi:hypothetical protein
MADRGGTRRTGTRRRHPRVSVPELPAPRGRQRRPHAHRPLGRLVAVDPTGQRLGGSLLVAAAGGRERSRGLPCRHRGHRRRRNPDPSALCRSRGRPVTNPQRVGPWGCWIPEPCAHGHARRGRVGDSGRKPDANRAGRHRAAATRSATDRPYASGRGADTAGCDADADTQPDGHADAYANAQPDTFAQPDPDARAVPINQPEPVMRDRVRAVSNRCVATPVQVLRS